ncbi:hypothetical protein [Caballeronia sp. GAWG1-5s-s]|uniref:hypothetical protein n=1 Tax=Caballeronia sp. GAWG1-5s-s TaxID=2921743 RepID=UPI0020297537|nr:hypothetical protein [Caballeronia sp. GAWG1-5s-s]
MATLTITDLAFDRRLDRTAMSAIAGGGGAPWVYGWITPFIADRHANIGGVVNVFEITNNFTAGQMINQFQSVDVRNSGDGANLTVTPNAISANRAG